MGALGALHLHECKGWRLAVSKRRASVGGMVLPKAGSKAGNRRISSVEQLLTSKQRQDLRDDLSEIARRRREAEASSSTLKLS